MWKIKQAVSQKIHFDLAWFQYSKTDKDLFYVLAKIQRFSAVEVWIKYNVLALLIENSGTKVLKQECLVKSIVSWSTFYC